MSKEIQILTSVPFDQLVDAIAEKLRPVINQAIADQLPDELISQQEAARIVGISTVTIWAYVRDGVLMNYGTGTQRPRLSRRECTELKKRMSNGRLKKAI